MQTTPAPTSTVSLGMRQVEERVGQPIALYLNDAYNGRHLSLTEIGAEIGVDKSTVSRWMRQLGITGIRYVGYRGRRT